MKLNWTELTPVEGELLAQIASPRACATTQYTYVPEFVSEGTTPESAATTLQYLEQQVAVQVSLSLCMKGYAPLSVHVDYPDTSFRDLLSAGDLQPLNWSALYRGFAPTLMLLADCSPPYPWIWMHTSPEPELLPLAEPENIPAVELASVESVAQLSSAEHHDFVVLRGEGNASDKVWEALSAGAWRPLLATGLTKSERFVVWSRWEVGARRPQELSRRQLHKFCLLSWPELLLVNSNSPCLDAAELLGQNSDLRPWKHYMRTRKHRYEGFDKIKHF